jgi:hypothetical protein
MRNWGIVVTAFYAVVVLLLLSFGMVLLAEDWWAFDTWQQSDFTELVFVALIPAAILTCGQLLLLFVSVDTSWRRLKPQRHAKVTAGLVGIMVTILAFAAMFSIGMAFSGDEFMNSTFTDMTEFQALTVLVVVVLVVWAFWGVVFYTFSKRSSNVVDSAVSWLIRGSVLELLVAVPCHIIVRQREWCCAQYVSAYGIAAGIAIMLMAFGPSAVFLYKKKLDEYKNRTAT